MQQIEAQKRPHYPQTDRLAILELRAACNWPLTQTARAFLVTPVTIASLSLITARGVSWASVYSMASPARFGGF